MSPADAIAIVPPPEISASAARAKWQVAAIWIAIALALRTIIAYFVPLLPDETYYWEWSRHLEAGYFDHPPGIALLISAGTALFGNTTFGVRSGPAAAALVAHIVIVMLAARLGGARAAARAACLVALLPLATLGLVLATPDAPLLACAAVALLCLERALSTPVRSKRSLAWWVLTGIALGAAFLSKYTAVLLPFSLVVACVAYAPLRARFREPGPWLASFTALFLFLPVVAWNARAGWVSFRFQLGHGFGQATRGTPIGRELELIGGQLGLATPILGVLLFIAVVLALRGEWHARARTRTTDKGAVRFALAASALMPLLFFAVSAWRRPVEPNWPALFYPGAMVLLAINWASWARSRWWKSGVAFAAGLLVLLVAQTWRPLAPLAPRKDPIARAHGWSTLAQAVDVARRDPFLTGTSKQWAAADRYQDASELAFHLHDQPQVFSLNLGGRPNQYDLWGSPSDNIQNADGLVVAFDATPTGDSLATVVGRWFQESKRGETVQLRREDGVIGERRVWLYRNALNIPAN
jgi:4-amino-4-deoxy-L-arabinose transferase-like glycosyltransferase